MEKQLDRFFDEMERILVELDTVRSQLVSVSASSESGVQTELAADVRALRERVGRERRGDGGGLRGMKPEEMIRGLPGPPVEEWIAMLPAGTHRERHAVPRRAGPVVQSREGRPVVGQARRGASRTAAVS